MFRFAQNDLIRWKDKPDRKPLIVRGARQVGKSFLISEFGKSHFDDVVEINFERLPEHAEFFKERSPQKIIQLIEAATDTTITPGKTLLFLDEAQAVPQLFPTLRYFYEEMPGLHIIAAGSLLEFILSDHDFSMPVGRVEFLHLFPMTFEEFVLAKFDRKKLDYLHGISLSDTIPEALHRQMLEALREYVLVGGMPIAVKTWIEQHSLAACEEAKHNLLSTVQSDFAKYRRRVPYERLVACLRRLPALIGRKVKYVNIDEHDTAKNLSAALDLLEMAQIIHRVFHTAAGGLPLGAERNHKIFKPLFLDVGLVSTLNGLNLTQLQDDLTLVNQGRISEQFVGQELLAGFAPYQKPEVYYWQRDKKNAAAEVDYVMNLENRIIPIEVKSGKTGRLRSLGLFCKEKNISLALRFNSDKPSLVRGEYTLASLPLYLTGQWRRLLASI
ncbi:MAG: ATP-binding protein [Deltaproteobacteria bacterium]|nr:ATP-binding protein [Deltaproteobacteria bacterium]